MPTYVILNPNAGSADDRATLEVQLQRLGSVTVITTEQPGDAHRLATRALDEGADLVIAAGGDGTINEVVNGLAANFAQARLGIIPLGTGNDFVRTVNVPTDPAAAVDVLLANQAQPLDVVRVRSDKTRYFINVSAGGFSGVVDEKLTGDLKRSWGPLAYLRSAAEALPELCSYRVQLMYDDEPPQTIEVYNVVIANARYVAGGIPIAPEADVRDGLLDVLLVKAATLPRMALLMPRILLGQHLDDDGIVFHRARKLHIDSEPRMTFNADGELVGDEPSTFDVLPGALRVIVGPAM